MLDTTFLAASDDVLYDDISGAGDDVLNDDVGYHFLTAGNDVLYDDVAGAGDDVLYDDVGSYSSTTMLEATSRGDDILYDDVSGAGNDVLYDDVGYYFVAAGDNVLNNNVRRNATEVVDEGLGGLEGFWGKEFVNESHGDERLREVN